MPCFFFVVQQFALAEPEPSCHSLVVLEGQKWKELRKAITPTFTASKMKQMSNIINQKIDSLTNRLAVQAENLESFDIYENFQALTLDVIGQCAFGMEVNCQTDNNDPFLLDAKELFRLFDMKNFPLNDKSVDMLHLLLEQQEWELTDGVIVGNAYTFLLAGYDTTSTALAFTAWLLAKYPEVQKKLQDEMDEKFEKNDNDNPDLLIEEQSSVNYYSKSAIDLGRHGFMTGMPYLDAVFRDSLRLFPPVITFVQRGCVEECQIMGHRFAANTDVYIPVYDIHRDPNLWPDPDRFHPESGLASQGTESIDRFIKMIATFRVSLSKE
uniref:Cytochrome P450 n=1 Tax=Romanomermis culicivorax TaxID=13658 RepID=A0A915JB11_ROMCU